MEIIFFAIVAYGLYNFLFGGNKKEKSHSTHKKDTSTSVGTSTYENFPPLQNPEMEHQRRECEQVSETVTEPSGEQVEQSKVSLPVETIPLTMAEDILQTIKQEVSINTHKRTLPKGEIRKLFEAKYANKYFPALQIVTDFRDLQFCPKDGQPLFKAKAVCKTARVDNARCCPLCSIAFVIKEEIIEDFNNGTNILWVCKYVQSCSKHKHTVVSATGILTRRDLSTVEINIQYCHNCREYFISKQQYDNYKIIYKDLMGNIQFVDNLTNKEPLTNLNFKLESPLHINGYNVSSNSRLTIEDRRRIIGYVIDNGILSKAEVVQHLSMLIDNAKHRRNANVANAIEKWEGDLDWVNYYRIDGQYKVHINRVLRKPTKRGNSFP